MRRDIYKEIPEDFHEQFCDTLARLGDVPVKHGRHPRKYGIILAAAILACASITVAAAGIMQWHKKLSERFGTEKELEDKLSMEQVAVPQNAVATGNGLEFRALQAVRTDTYDYFLVEMMVPEQVHWNGDVLFEECGVSDGRYGCIVNFVEDSLEDGKVLLEMQILYDEGEIPKEGEICVRLKNLVQTEKLEIKEYLVEGEWELNLTLPPAEADTVRFYPECSLILGEHEVYLEKADISPFRLRFYTERDFALHAAWGKASYLTGVWYEDGTIVEESGLPFSMAGHMDENEEFCYEFALENAVDPDRIAGILISDGGEERKMPLDRIGSKTEQSSAESGEFSDGNAQKPSGQNGCDRDGSIAEVQLISVRYDNVVLETGGSVCLWDARCGKWQELFALDAYGFSREDGGEFCMGNASQILLLPRADSEELYMYEIAGESMLTLDAENFWPWATYDSYRENCKDITEVLPDADERYAGQAFRAQGGWYYLYSEDGSLRKMELRTD